MRLSTLALSLTVLAALAACSPQDSPQDSGGDDSRVRPAAQPSTPGPTTVQVGKPFTFDELELAGAPSLSWQVTVTSVKCGLTSIPLGAENPNWNGDADLPQYVDALPPKGQKFCRAEATLVNKSKNPSNTAPRFGQIVTDRGSFSATEDVRQVAHNLMFQTERLTVDDGDPINPGAEAWLVGVWALPEGMQVSAVLWPETDDGSATHRIVVD